MMEGEKATVGVKDSMKPTAFKVEADNVTCDFITSDSTPCAAIPAHVP